LPIGDVAMSFRNRTEAGKTLARAVARYRNEPCVVLALPRGGVPVAAEVAKALKAPLDLILVRKIGVPVQPELAMGAAADGGEPVIVRNEDVIREAGITDEEFKTVCERELVEIGRRRKKYLGQREPTEVAGRIAILVDDGVATGATTRAALRSVRKRNPKKLILAVPVAPSDTIAALKPEADDIVCLESHVFFGAIGFFYADFRQVSDEEVIAILNSFRQGNGESKFADASAKLGAPAQH
jgi:putative phosphoribosyl transferase